MVREVNDPLVGGMVLHPGIVPRVAEDVGAVRWCGPEIGAHNAEVLGDLLGLTQAEVRDIARPAGLLRTSCQVWLKRVAQIDKADALKSAQLCCPEEQDVLTFTQRCWFQTGSLFDHDLTDMLCAAPGIILRAEVLM